MMQNNYADGSKFHIIGHSAGAYISITAGKFIREWSSAHKLRRITLLDTGVLVYRNDDFAHNTTYKEAHFVDVIHADAGTCFGSVVGALTPLGHADFFPNGGTLQLSCYFHAIEAILRGDILVGGKFF
nr:hepatic triacylglycerol lipase-like [Parasteatoda tepidariorum]